MKISKVLLITLIVFFLSGCVNLDELSYTDILNNFNTAQKRATVFKEGYQFFTPKGIQVSDAGSNYVILSSNDSNYYLYVDLVSYNKKNSINYEVNNKAHFSKAINYNKNTGYVEIDLWENDKYLIEIMYNYAKIEVMVEESMIKNALINSISILKSIKYNNDIIEKLLNDDNLNYTEEKFDVFEESKKPENSDETKNDTEDYIEEEIKDTDYIN